MCRIRAFELLGSERSRQRLIRRVQARWRGVLARRKCIRLWTEQRCRHISSHQLSCLIHMQAMCRGACTRQRLRSGGMQLPEDVRREKAAVRLQAAVRALAARREVESRRQRHRKLQWAQQVSRVDDDDEDIAPIDVSEFLGGLDDALGVADPFAIRVPEPSTAFIPMPTVSARSARDRPSMTSSEEPVRGAREHTKPPPINAWSTPPPSAGALGDTRSSLGSPASRAGDERPRLARSLSSTAGSAHSDGNAYQCEPVQDEWTKQQQAIRDARRKREKPPGMPKLSNGISRGGGHHGRGSASGRGGGSGRRLAGPSPTSGDKPILKAQDQIAAFMAMQAQEASGRASPDPEALEFSSGAPNRRLLRSAMQSPPPHSSPSPRAGSPHNFST